MSQYGFVSLDFTTTTHNIRILQVVVWLLLLAVYKRLKAKEYNSTKAHLSTAYVHTLYYNLLCTQYRLHSEECR
jgi:hypothetical protein